MLSLEKHVNFENENSRKAYYREFKKVYIPAPYMPQTGPYLMITILEAYT